MIYRGGCHCGAIAFEAPGDIVVMDCNCSICTKSAYLHLIVPRSKFRLLKGEVHLSLYMFNSGIARHYFCTICGIKPFYIPRSNPDGIDVNARCLESPPSNLTIQPLDGRNWERNAAELKSLSKD